MVIKYVKEVGKFSYEQSQGYSDEGIDLRSAEYFRMLREGNFNLPVAGIRNDIYVRRHVPYNQGAQKEQHPIYNPRQAFSKYSSTYQYQ